jgi:hypothetical protein
MRKIYEIFIFTTVTENRPIHELSSVGRQVSPTVPILSLLYFQLFPGHSNRLRLRCSLRSSTSE